MSTVQVFNAADEWGNAMREAWNLAYGERMNELHDERRAKLLDERGLHPWSIVWGKILFLEGELDPAQLGTYSHGEHSFEAGKTLPWELRETARKQATADYARAIIEKGDTDADVDQEAPVPAP